MKQLLAVLLVVATATGLFLAPGGALPAAASSASYQFDRTLAPWLPGADHGAFGDQTLVRQASGGSPFCASDGNGYASLVENYSPRKGEGTWIVASFEAAGPTYVGVDWSTLYKVQAPAWCNQICNATAYIGTSLPTDSSQFTPLGTLPNNWKQFNYSKSLAAEGTIYVAIGWRAEVPYDEPEQTGQMVVNLDCVNISIRPVG